MLGMMSQTGLKRKLTSSTTGVAHKRRRTSPYVFDGSASDHSPSQSKIIESVEGCSPTFSARSFYSPKGQGGYQTPGERQQRREDLGQTLPTKPPVEIQIAKQKNNKHKTSTRGSHLTKHTQLSGAAGQPLLKSKTCSKRGVKSQSQSLDKSTSKASITLSPNKKVINKSLKKSPKKRSPSKRTPRKSPRKGVKKAVKLYLQGLKRKKSVMSGKRRTTVNVKAIDKEALVDMPQHKQPTSSKGASKKLDLQDESLVNQGISKEIHKDIEDDLCVIAPSPKLAKKRVMRSNEESETFIPGKKVRRSPRKSVKSFQKKVQEDVYAVSDDKHKENEHILLKGFEPDTPDSMTLQITLTAFPKKAHVSTITAAITPPMSPSNMKMTTSSRNSPASSTPLQQKKLNLMRKMTDKDGLEQMTLDLGQQHFGAVTCQMCGMVYTAAHPEDEALHDKFHRKYLNSIKFRGWKNERILQEFDDGRVIMVLYDDPKYHIKKVEEIRQLVDQELGFHQGGDVACKSSCKVLLFITTEKKVAGCLIAEEINKGYRVVADRPKETATSSLVEQQQFEQQRAWCCHTNPEPANCGVSRIWVASQERRKQVATRMLDCLRNVFTFGTVLPKASVAFSDPTPDGKMLATCYIGTAQFLVYKYQ